MNSRLHQDHNSTTPGPELPEEIQVPPFDDTIVHTQPRMIPASYVREGDELATYASTGLLVGTEKGVRDADWHREIDWLDITGPFSSEDGGVPTSYVVVPVASDGHVVVRERVSTDT